MAHRTELYLAKGGRRSATKQPADPGTILATCVAVGLPALSAFGHPEPASDAIVLPEHADCRSHGDQTPDTAH